MAAKSIAEDKRIDQFNANYYCDGVFSSLGLGPEKGSKGKGSTPSVSSGAESAAQVHDPVEEYHLVPKLREILVITSFGDRFPPGLCCVHKKEGTNDLSEDPNKREKTTLIRRELHAILEQVRKDSSYRVVGVCYDYPGAQRTKAYYLERIKEHLLACSDAAVIWYTGVSERETGNWCFTDGVIALEEIFELYLCHFRSKLLYLVCDCSFSGGWVNKMASTLDSHDVLSCGHYAKIQGMTIKVFVSCRAHEEATELCFAREALEYNETEQYLGYCHKTLSSGQSTVIMDFTKCKCGKKLEENCQINHEWKWVDRITDVQLLYWVRGFDTGRPAWHCVLLREGKKKEFVQKTQEEAGKHTLNLLDYGRIIKSGWGKDPPEEVVKEIERQYH